MHYYRKWYTSYVVSGFQNPQYPPCSRWVHCMYVNPPNFQRLICVGQKIEEIHHWPNGVGSTQVMIQPQLFDGLPTPQPSPTPRLCKSRQPLCRGTTIYCITVSIKGSLIIYYDDHTALPFHLDTSNSFRGETKRENTTCWSNFCWCGLKGFPARGCRRELPNPESASYLEDGWRCTARCLRGGTCR